MSIDYGIESVTSMSEADLSIDNLPLDQLLHSEWFHQNISQMLNISVDNLTSLLIHAQNAGMPGQGQGQGQGQGSPVHHPQRDPMPLLAMLTTFYALIFVAGVLGNLITCIVISRNKFMHTATNFYLFNLAVSDLILLLSGMPQDLYNIWYPTSYPFTDVLCVMESVLSETAANATVLTITAFTVERYIAICHPFRQHTMSKLSRAVKFIFAIWIAAFLLALPQAMQFSVVSQGGGTSCTMNNDFFAHVFAVSGFIFFGGPMTAICVLYVLIGLKLKRSRLLQALPRRCYDVNRGISAQSRVIRMLVAVAVTFFLCWAPFHAQRLMAVYGSTAGIESEVFNDIFHILDYTSGVLYFLSTCINPLLYNIMSHKFREAFKVTLARHFGLAGKHQTQHHNYSALLRQNGSMRLHTTVNNNALEQFSSYRVVHLHCRDPSHHLSLQDSIRTTTTTTTMNSGIGSGGGGGGGGGAAGGGSGATTTSSGGGSGPGSCRSSGHRNRCVSIGSQATLLASLSKNEIYTTASRSNGAPDHHRTLQSQISQISSVGDASSLLDSSEICTHTAATHPHTYARPVASYRLKELGRSLAHSGRTRNKYDSPIMDRRASNECNSSLLSTQEWAENDGGGAGDGHSSEQCLKNETDFTSKAVVMPASSRNIPNKHPPQQQQQRLNSLDDYTAANQPSRSRLKLSRIIINRRDQHHPLKPSEHLAEKFRWRRRKKKSKATTSRSKENTSTSTPTPTSSSSSSSSSTGANGLPSIAGTTTNTFNDKKSKYAMVENIL